MVQRRIRQEIPASDGTRTDQNKENAMQYASIMPRLTQQQGQQVNYVGDNVGGGGGGVGRYRTTNMLTGMSASGQPPPMGNPSASLPYGPMIPPGQFPPTGQPQNAWAGMSSLVGQPSAQGLPYGPSVQSNMPYGPFIPQGQFPPAYPAGNPASAQGLPYGPTIPQGQYPPSFPQWSVRR